MLLELCRLHSALILNTLSFFHIDILDIVHLCKLLLICKMKDIQVVFNACFVNDAFMLILAYDCLCACVSQG